MKRIKIVGLCLVAMFAITALATSSASAANPEHGYCVAQKKGKYLDAGCTKSVTKKGKFEWTTPGQCFAKKKGKYSDAGCTKAVTKKGKFEKAPSSTYTASSGTATLNTPALGSTVCTASTTTGKLLSAKTGEAVATFTGCTSKSQPCENSPVGPSGVVTTATLETNLVETPAGSKFGEELFSGKGQPYSSEFFCNAIGTFVRTTGFNGGHPLTLNKMTSTNTIEFGGAVQQALLTEVECGPGEWSGESSSLAACTAAGIPFAGPGEPPVGGQFHSEELETVAQTSTPAYETRTN